MYIEKRREDKEDICIDKLLLMNKEYKYESNT